MAQTLAEQAQQLIELAERNGAASNFLFKTTFKSFQTQLKILSELETVINEEGAMVTKEYVKGRKNVYTNPAIVQYNKTVDSANKTAITLMDIIKRFENK